MRNISCYEGGVMTDLYSSGINPYYDGQDKDKKRKYNYNNLAQCQQFGDLDPPAQACTSYYLDHSSDKGIQSYFNQHCLQRESCRINLPAFVKDRAIDINSCNQDEARVYLQVKCEQTSKGETRHVR